MLGRPAGSCAGFWHSVSGRTTHNFLAKTQSRKDRKERHERKGIFMEGIVGLMPDAPKMGAQNGLGRTAPNGRSKTRAVR